jgi:hypothetical protein
VPPNPGGHHSKSSHILLQYFHELDAFFSPRPTQHAKRRYSLLVSQLTFELRNLGLQLDFGIGVGAIVFLEIHPGSSKVYHMLEHHIATVRLDKTNEVKMKKMDLKFSAASLALIKYLAYSLALVWPN